MVDWRDGSSDMSDLISKLHERPSSDSYTDITFKLPDGGTVSAHKLILAIASPFFEAQFYGLLANDHNGCVEVKEVDSDAFRRLLDFIYSSSTPDWDLDSMEYWNLLHAAHMYLLPVLIEHCNEKLCDYLTSLEDNNELVDHVNRATQLYIHDDIAKAGVLAIKKKVKEILPTQAWLTLQDTVVLELVSDINLKVTEGDLFTSMVRWCRANTKTEEEAVKKFQNYFADKILGKNISEPSFLKEFKPLVKFVPAELFQRWTFEIMETKCKEGTRFALNPLKVQQTTIKRRDFLDPKGTPSFMRGNGQGSDYDLWKSTDEFPDVDIDIKIYQKISEGIHVPRGKFGILLETVHRSKDGVKANITERVSVKMVAKKADDTVVKKLFKPIEDSVRDGWGETTNIFVLSKNREERVEWNRMEIVVIIDRRPDCHIKGISGEKFSTTVCSAPTSAYLDQAQSFRFDIGMPLGECLRDLAGRLNVCLKPSPDGNPLNQWLYIFTKGYVSNLRSRRAMPNDYWSAKTVGDFMRCKVINFPIGTHNEETRRDAFRTWIVGRKHTDEKDKEKKNVFVVRYNPLSQTITYVKSMLLFVDTRVETLGYSEHINLGWVRVTEDLINAVLMDTGAAPGSRVFIRRIFPIQEDNEVHEADKLVSEATVGDYIDYIDDCHVLVIQDPGEGPDYDEYLISKVREIKIQFEPREENGGSSVELSVDPEISYIELVRRLGSSLGVDPNILELFKCYAPKSMKKRSAEFPVDVEIEKNVEGLLEWCKEGPKTIFYRLKSTEAHH